MNLPTIAIAVLFLELQVLPKIGGAEPTGPAAATPGPSAAGPTGSSEIRLTLQEALLLAVRNNLAIQAGRLTPQILDDDIVQAGVKYDYVLSTKVNSAKSREQTISQLAGASTNETKRTEVNLGASRQLRTGADASLVWENSRDRNNSLFVDVDPAYDSRLGVSVTQPLLKGRGAEVNEGAIRIAQNNQRMGELDFRQVALETLASTERAYWDLVFTLENEKIQKLSLQQARALLEVNRQKVAAGLITENEMIETQAEAAEREERIILAEQEVRSSEDRLKTLTNLIEQSAAWESPIVPLTSPPSDLPPLEAEAAFERAFQNRPDYLKAEKDLKNRDIAIVLARNARYPQLDLQATFGLNGVTGGYGNTIDSVVSTDFYDWGVGVSLELPLGLRSGRSLWKRRQFEKAQAILRFKELGNQVIAEVRDALRSAEAARKRIGTTEVAQRLWEAKLASEQERYQVGKSTTTDILEFQLDLARARTNYVRSRLTYQQALVDIELAKGTLLDSRGLGLSPEGPAEGKPVPPTEAPKGGSPEPGQPRE